MFEIVLVVGLVIEAVALLVLGFLLIGIFIWQDALTWPPPRIDEIPKGGGAT